MIYEENYEGRLFVSGRKQIAFYGRRKADGALPFGDKSPRNGDRIKI